MSDNPPDEIDKLLFGAILQCAKLAKMARNVEKDKNTHVVFAEIAIVAASGHVVYCAWNTPETKQYLDELVKNISQDDNAQLTEGLFQSLSEVVPFGLYAQMTIKDKESRIK